MAAAPIFLPKSKDNRSTRKVLRVVKVGGAVIGTIEATKPSGKGRGRKWSVARQQAGEITSLVSARFRGPILTDDAAMIAGVVAALIPAHEFRAWATVWVPGLPIAELEAILAGPKHRMSAQALGDLLNVTPTERRELGMRTIRYAGQTDEVMRQERRYRDNESRRDKRASKERVNLSKSRPWQDLGVSRATFYRMRKVDTKNGCNINTPTAAAICIRDEGQSTSSPAIEVRGERLANVALELRDAALTMHRRLSKVGRAAEAAAARIEQQTIPVINTALMLRRAS